MSSYIFLILDGLEYLYNIDTCEIIRFCDAIILEEGELPT